MSRTEDSIRDKINITDAIEDRFKRKANLLIEQISIENIIDQLILDPQTLFELEGPLVNLTMQSITDGFTVGLLIGNDVLIETQEEL